MKRIIASVIFGMGIKYASDLLLKKKTIRNKELDKVMDDNVINNIFTNSLENIVIDKISVYFYKDIGKIIMDYSLSIWNFDYDTAGQIVNIKTPTNEDYNLQKSFHDYK